MILLASTMDGLDLSRSRVMVAAVQSLAFYCFPLLTGLLLHVMRHATMTRTCCADNTNAGRRPAACMTPSATTWPT